MGFVIYWHESAICGLLKRCSSKQASLSNWHSMWCYCVFLGPSWALPEVRRTLPVQKGPLHTLPANVGAWKVAGGRVQHKGDLVLRIQWLWPKDSRENIVGRGLVLCLGLLLFSHSVMSNSLRPCGLQHARPPCPSPSPWVCSNSYPLSRWCHLTILSSVAPFSCPQSFLASRSFPMS